MTPEPENFDALRRLLKLKRYEQPPPGYFNHFSRQVVARLRLDVSKNRAHPLVRLSWEAPWLRRLLEAFQAKPELAVTFGAAVCALLVGGVIYSESMEHKPATLPAMSADANQATPVPIAPTTFGLSDLGEGTLAVTGTNDSLNPIIQPGGSLFDQFRINPQPVSFPLHGNGN
ncbi:MAG: hypothetical protein AAB380_06970 [Verrucomicrobiota bacterium]